MSSALPDPAAVLATYLHEAVAEARIAYEFVPISHTYSALQACLAAEQALAVLRDALEAGGRHYVVYMDETPSAGPLQNGNSGHDAR
jgi:hypothetical protein